MTNIEKAISMVNFSSKNIVAQSLKKEILDAIKTCIMQKSCPEDWGICGKCSLHCEEDCLYEKCCVKCWEQENEE